MNSECGYCGAVGPGLEDEHVVPKCLYPSSKATSKVQRITIPACPSCNRSWSDDEAHFRNIVLVTGDSNPVVQELWPKAVRSFKICDGQRRLGDVRQLMEKIDLNGAERWKIYPGRDARILRVVRKIVRGLSYYHKLGLVPSDNQVWTDVLKDRIPDELLASVEFRHREPDIFQYWFEPYDDGELRSIWHLKFYERLSFIALVEHKQETQKQPEENTGDYGSPKDGGIGSASDQMDDALKGA